VLDLYLEKREKCPNQQELDKTIEIGFGESRLLFMCLMRKSVHCLTNKLFMAMDEVASPAAGVVLDDVNDDDVLLLLLTGRVCITLSNCFCTSVQLMVALDKTLLHKSIQ